MATDNSRSISSGSCSNFSNNSTSSTSTVIVTVILTLMRISPALIVPEVIAETDELAVVLVVVLVILASMTRVTLLLLVAVVVAVVVVVVVVQSISGCAATLDGTRNRAGEMLRFLSYSCGIYSITLNFILSAVDMQTVPSSIR